MNNRIKSFVGLATFLLLGAAANAQTEGTRTQNTETGHYYQIIAYNGITWDQSQAHVLTLPCIAPGGIVDASCSLSGAVSPHLATITSSREDDFVDGLRDGEIEDCGEAEESCTGVLEKNETWLGGIQDGPGSEPVDGWRWVNGEGNFPGVNDGAVYANWNEDEPNDLGGEDHLAVGLDGLGGGWNDEGSPGNIGGFIVEWDVPKKLDDCEGGSGCVTIEGHTLVFPEDSIPPGATLSFNSFEFLDPRVDGAGVCNLDENGDSLMGDPRVPLRIFGETGIGSAPGERPEMFIPPYLCGSPKFVIIAVDTVGFALKEGTVLVTNETKDVLPDNVYPDGQEDSVCEDPIPQDTVDFLHGDPQYQDVVVWQTTDPGKMLEETFGPNVGGTGEFAGAAGEFTHDCGGSSRSKTRGGSDFGIGFHIDFGPGNTWAGNSPGNLGKFVELTNYKLKLLERSVEDAKKYESLNNKDYKKLKKHLDQATKQIGKGNYNAAHSHVKNFLNAVDKANYATPPEENYNGEHIMRGGNIAFMLRVKIVPYASEVAEEEEPEEEVAEEEEPKKKDPKKKGPKKGGKKK